MALDVRFLAQIGYLGSFPRGGVISRGGCPRSNITRRGARSLGFRVLSFYYVEEEREAQPYTAL